MRDEPPGRPFAPVLGALLIVILIIAGAPMAALPVLIGVCQGGINPTAVAAGAAAWAALVVAGLWWARKWATRDRQRRQTPGDNDPVAAPGGIWRVPDPGISLLDSPWGARVAARLGPGTQVIEVDRYGERLQVTAPDGSTGWVDARLLALPDAPNEGASKVQEQENPEGA